MRFHSSSSERIGWMRQSVNVDALKKLFVVVLRPLLVVPTIQIDALEELDVQDLKDNRAVRAIVFDKDNTLTYTYDKALHPSVIPALERSKEVFGRNIAILSNSVGSSDDTNYEVAKETEVNLGIAVIRHRRKKPDCLDEVLDHFKDVEGLKPENICVVGDRVLTDIVFGNLHGMTTVLVKPLSYVRDHPIALVLRCMERWLLLPIVKLFFQGTQRKSS